MKYALITGPNGFHLVDQYRLGYHLVLAHKCLEDREYLDFYDTLHKKGHFIILDNGAAEMQHSIPFEKVLRVAAQLHPDEIVMPDALGDGGETMGLFDSWTSKVPLRHRMGVPQGESWEEWRNCLHHMLRAGVASIGIAKRYEAVEGGRYAAVQYFSSLYEAPDVFYNERVHVHLLGCYNNPVKEINRIQTTFKWVRGVDTAAPLAHAQCNLGMKAEYGHISYAWNEPFHEAQAKDNIEEVLAACTS